MDIQQNKIVFGDRIFARLTMGGRTIAELMLNHVADMTELLGELRTATLGLRGLATLYIRNQSRGWSRERPLMLYSGSLPRNHTAAYPAEETATRPQRRMLFHWEV